jgi:mRNA interferase MazF
MALTEAAVPTEDLELPERRPALVLSPAAYSAKVGLAVLCPIAGQAKGYPFEVELSRGLPVHGVVLADRVTSLDWRSCGVRLACTAPDGVVVAVQERLMQLLA